MRYILVHCLFESFSTHSSLKKVVYTTRAASTPDLTVCCARRFFPASFQLRSHNQAFGDALQQRSSDHHTSCQKPSILSQSASLPPCSSEAAKRRTIAKIQMKIGLSCKICKHRHISPINPFVGLPPAQMPQRIYKGHQMLT